MEKTCQEKSGEVKEIAKAFEEESLKPIKRERKPLRLRKVRFRAPSYYSFGTELLSEKVKKAFSGPKFTQLCQKSNAKPEIVVNTRPTKLFFSWLLRQNEELSFLEQACLSPSKPKAKPRL